VSERPGADTPLLELRRVTKHYGGVQALDDVCACLGRGEHVAVVGDNGAGKSTLVKILSGAARPDGGEIWFDGGMQAFASPIDARGVGIETVYQNLAVADHLDVVANLFLGHELYAFRAGPFSVLNIRRMRREAEHLLALTGVHIPNLRESVHNLSGGQRQGIAIARAVGWGSRLIIMDEPTAALGVQEAARVEEIVRGLKGAGVAALIVSHNLRQVFELADTVWVMRHGRLIAKRSVVDTTTEEIVQLITGARETAGERA
jgi:fructose transport system ATP-binding protein